MKTVLILSLAIALVGCARSTKTDLPGLRPQFANPNSMPTVRNLQDSTPLLAVKLEASDAGYTLKAFRTTGTPTSRISLNRDVEIKALDKDGKPVMSVSIDNPRDVHTTGTERPATAVLSKAKVTVFLVSPDQIRSIEVNVLRGANAGLKKTFSIDPEKLTPLERFNPARKPSPGVVR